LRTFSAFQVRMPSGCSSPSSVYSWLIASSACVLLFEASGRGKYSIASWCMPACNACSSALLPASILNAGCPAIAPTGSPQR
jgi:hypothetical protein